MLPSSKHVYVCFIICTMLKDYAKFYSICMSTSFVVSKIFVHGAPKVLWKGKMRTFQAVNTYYNTMLSLARLLDHPSGRLHLPEFNYGGEQRQEEIKERQSCKVSLTECNLWRMKTSGTLMMVIDCKILFQIVRVAYCRMSPARKEIIS